MPVSKGQYSFTHLIRREYRNVGNMEKRSGLKLALWPRKSLAAAASLRNRVLTCTQCRFAWLTGAAALTQQR